MTLEKFSITLIIESRLDQIRMIRAAFAGVLRHLDVGERDIDALGLAITEIINNSVEHGYRGREDQQVEVRVEVSGSEIQVDIVDHAPPFPASEEYRFEGEVVPFEIPSEEWATRGHGLQIARSIVDSIALNREGDSNRYTLKKHVERRAD